MVLLPLSFHTLSIAEPSSFSVPLLYNCRLLPLFSLILFQNITLPSPLSPIQLYLLFVSKWPVTSSPPSSITLPPFYWPPPFPPIRCFSLHYSSSGESAAHPPPPSTSSHRITHTHIPLQTTNSSSHTLNLWFMTPPPSATWSSSPTHLTPPSPLAPFVSSSAAVVWADVTGDCAAGVTCDV